MNIYNALKSCLIIGLITSLSACGKSVPITPTLEVYDVNKTKLSLIQETLDDIKRQLKVKLNNPQKSRKKQTTKPTLNIKKQTTTKKSNIQQKTAKSNHVKKTELPKTATYPKAIPFKLEDQNGDFISFNYPREKLAIIAMADKDGSEQMESWITPLYQRYTDNIDIFGVAELSIVPGFVRGIVKAIFTTQLKKYPVMLDWKGEVTKAYNYQEKHTNLFIIDQQGNIRGKIIGPINQVNLNQVVTLIDRLLKKIT